MRQRIIDAAMEAILEVGYARTSIGEVVKRAGVTKGAFVYVFKNKLEFIKATVDYLFEAGRKKTASLDFSAPKTVEDVEKTLQLTADVLLDKIGMAIFEVWMASRTDPELRETFTMIEAKNSFLRKRVLEKTLGQDVLESTDLLKLSEGAIMLLRGFSLQEVLDGGVAQSDLWLWWRRRLAEEMFACKNQADK
jgi:AcrR family transcriptional regulator